jgi:hypothetical protein
MATNLQVQSTISSTAQYVQDASSNNSSLAISSGNIGIGTSNPVEPLTVSGVIRALSSGNSRYRSDHYVGAGDSKGHINAYDDTGAVHIPLNIDASPIVLNYTSGGFVGIGMTNPGWKLSVQDSSHSIQAFFGQGNSSGQSQIAIGQADQTQKAVIIGYNHASGYGYMQIDGYGTGLVISSTSQVGIGTTNPIAILDVNGDVNIAAGHILSLGGASAPWIMTGSGSPGTISRPKGSLYINTNPSGANDRLWISKGSGSWAYISASS